MLLDRIVVKLQVCRAVLSWQSHGKSLFFCKQFWAIGGRGWLLRAVAVLAAFVLAHQAAWPFQSAYYLDI
eukprot:3300036-Amphidinium_carterae.1